MRKNSYEYRRPQCSPDALSTYLHWFELSDGFVITKDGMLQKTILLELPSNDSSDQKSAEVSLSFQRWLNGLPDDTAITFEVSHYIPDKRDYLDMSSSMTGAASQFEKIRAQQFSDAKSFVNKTFATFVFKPAVTKDYEITESSKEDAEKKLATFISQLSTFGIYARSLNDDETLTYLHSCISSESFEVKTSQVGLGYDLDLLLSDCDITADTNPLKIGSEYVKVLTLRDIIAPQTISAMMDKLCSSQIRFRWISKYRTKNAESSMTFVKRKHRMYLSRRKDLSGLLSDTMNQTDNALEDIQALSDADSCALCEGILAESGMNIGSYACFLVLYSDSEKRLRNEVEKMIQFLHGKGIIVKEETLGLFGSWTATMPGNPWMGYREIAVTNQNFADLMRLSIPFVGWDENEHMKEVTGCAAPLLYGRSVFDRSICYFSPNGSRSDVGHTAVFGQTGSGKSILLGAMDAQFLKYPEARVILFDKDASALTNFAINQNGKVYRPLIDDTTFQPLQNSHREQSRCMRFLEALASVQNVRLDANDREELSKTLKLLPPGSSTLSVYARALQGKNHSSKMVSALMNYTVNGTYGAIFDSDHDTFAPENFGTVTLIETTELMKAGDVCIIPALAYVFSQLEALFRDRKPTLLVLDEAWEYLKHPFFASTIQEWLRTLRKLNVFVVIATQEISAVPEDVLKTVTASVFTSIYLPTAGANTEALRNTYKTVGVTDEELILISRLSPKRDYLIKQDNKHFMCVDFCFTEDQLKLFKETGWEVKP